MYSSNNMNLGWWLDQQYGKIYIDKSFQRDLVWGRETGDAFLESCFRHRALTPIVVAHVEGCLLREPECVTTARIRNSYTYISLDGQNRAHYIYRFKNNLVSYTGTVCSIYDSDPDLQVVNIYFRQLAQKYQQHFLNSPLVFQVFTQLGYEELPETFRALNAGCSLNHQETRNSQQSPIAAHIRQKRKSYKGVFKRYFSTRNLNNMHDGEYIAKMLLHYEGFEIEEKTKVPLQSVGHKYLDAYYERGVKSDLPVDGKFATAAGYSQKSMEALNMAIDNVRAMLKVVPAPKERGGVTPLRKEGELSLLVWVGLQLHRDGYEISDSALAFEEINKADERLARQSEKAYYAALQNNPNAQKGYHEWKRVNWNTARYQRLDALVAELLQDPTSNGIALKQAAA